MKYKRDVFLVQEKNKQEKEKNKSHKICSFAFSMKSSVTTHSVA